MENSILSQKKVRETSGAYFASLNLLLRKPSVFFEKLPEKTGFAVPFRFLILSTLFFTAASLTIIHDQMLLSAAILCVNAVGMPFIAAAFGFVGMSLVTGKAVTFSRLFAVYAYSWGVTMLISWIPLLMWVAEPWKWYLIGVGLVKGFGLKCLQAIMIVVVTLVLLILFFYLLVPSISG